MFYVLDEHNNKVEAFDKQGVLAVLEQAIENGSLAEITSDSAFITKLKCCVGTGTHHIAFVTQAIYNELKENNQLIADAYYFITDDTTTEDMTEQMQQLANTVNGFDDRITALEDKTVLNKDSVIGKPGIYVVYTTNGFYTFTIVISNLLINASGSIETVTAANGSTTIVANAIVNYSATTGKITIYDNITRANLDYNLAIYLIKEL